MDGFAPDGPAMGTATAAQIGDMVREHQETNQAGSIVDPSDRKCGRQPTIASIVRTRGQPVLSMAKALRTGVEGRDCRVAAGAVG